MTSLDICNFEDFTAEVTAQAASLEEAASAQEILTQQLEGYLNRMREAICADVTNLQTQITNIVPGGAGEVWKISERIANVNQPITTGPTALPFDFEIAGINDAPSELTWDAVAFAWENVSSATLFVNALITLTAQNTGGSGRPLFDVQRDSGAGFAHITGGFFFSEVGRMSAAKVLRIDMAPGDKIAVAGRAIVGTVSIINDSNFQLLSRTTAAP